MTVPSKLYYKITELSGGRWPTTTKGDILEWCLAGHFPLYVYWAGMQAKTPFEQEDSPKSFFSVYARIPSCVIEKMALLGEDTVSELLFYLPAQGNEFYNNGISKEILGMLNIEAIDGFEPFLSGAIIEGGFEDIPYTIHKNELLMSGSDVHPLDTELIAGKGVTSRVVAERKQEAFLLQSRLAIFSTRLEAMTEEAASQKEPSVETPGVEKTSESAPTITKVLDDTHNWHSKRLACAVKAWLELYENREGNSMDNAFKPKGGNIEFIDAWLKKNALDIDVHDHIAIVVNPSKKSGPRSEP